VLIQLKNFLIRCNILIGNKNIRSVSLKLFLNIIPAIKLGASLTLLAKYKKGIYKARLDGDYEKERDFILKSTTTWGNHLVKIYDIDLSVTGKENLPEKGPVVFVANHQGYADIPITCATFDKFQFGYVAKDSLTKVPFYGKWIKNIRSVFIKRNDSRESLMAISEGISFIEKGFSLMIFPEGTRSKGGPVKEFKKGSLRLATKPGVPVIPVTINGTHRVFEDNGYIKNGASVKIKIHPAIETKGMSKAEANNLSEEVEKIVRSGLVSE
jgi:1-acyl-sn-glycerol-3-phosphate acyltransferase